MKKRMSVICAALLVSLTAALAQSPAEASLYQELVTVGLDKVTSAAIDRVLKSSDNYSAAILYVASLAALNEKRLEDAGFLFYIAQIRVHFDKSMFPPKGTGGEDPMFLFGDCNAIIGAQINPAIMSAPKVYAKALARVKAWKPHATAQYEPGWEYLKRGSEKEATEAIAEYRKENITHLSEVSTLLLDAKYFDAYKIVHDRYFIVSTTNRPSKEAYDVALQAMDKIEKEKGIQGIAYIIKERDGQVKDLNDKPGTAVKK